MEANWIIIGKQNKKVNTCKTTQMKKMGLYSVV